MRFDWHDRVWEETGEDVGWQLPWPWIRAISAPRVAVVVTAERATSVFRLQDGEWKLVHHHTDHSVPLQAAFIKN